MFKEFKTFAMKGNILDMAIGIVIGVAFGKIVTSFVNDVLMPPVGLLLGRMDFSNLFINLSDTVYPTLAAAKEAGAPTVNYGLFLNTVLDFFIVAFVLFLMIKQVERFKKKEEIVKHTRECPYCISEISLKATRCPHCTAELTTERQ